MVLQTIKEFVKQEVFANIYAFVAERKIKGKYEDDGKTLVISEKSVKNIRATLDAYEEKEVERKRSIEEKAKSSLFVVALSVTISMTILGLLKDFHLAGITIAAVVLFLVALLYLILASITAIKAINIGEFHSLSLSHFIEREDGSLKRTRISDAEKAVDLYKYLKLNQRTNNIKANYVYATFIGIRNGIVLLALFFFILLVSPRGASSQATPQFQIGNVWLSKPDSVTRLGMSVEDSVVSKRADSTTVSRIERRELQLTRPTMPLPH